MGALDHLCGLKRLLLTARACEGLLREGEYSIGPGQNKHGLGYGC